MRNGLLERAGGSLRRSCLTVAALIYLTAFVGEAWAGAFTFSNETDRRDVVTHPKGYNGSGGNLVVTVCVNPASAHATAMVISTQNAVNTWNGLIATSPNLLSGTSNNIPAGQMDFESTLLLDRRQSQRRQQSRRFQSRYGRRRRPRFERRRAR
jgi:hypothetical protein